MKFPKHGTIEEDIIPAQLIRRKWCVYCNIWTRQDYNGIWRHRARTRTQECKDKNGQNKKEKK